MYILASIMLLTFVACEQPTSTETDDTNTVETEVVKEKEPKPLTKLDSLDKVNGDKILAAGDEVTKAYISKGTIYLSADKMTDHRFFGYEKPDTESKRLILISVFTDDVEGNPFGCKLGAYYDMYDMSDMDGMDLSYLETVGDFVKIEATKGTDKTIFYFEKKWVDV